MKHVILLRDGDGYQPNVFADLRDIVNRPLSVNDTERVDFFARTEHTFRIYPNTSLLEREKPLALAHTAVDNSKEVQLPSLYRPIDVQLLRTAADNYSFVLFGVMADRQVLTDPNLLQKIIYIVRDNTGQFINYETNERLFSLGTASRQSIVCFVGMIKVGRFPVYYMLTDPTLVKVGGGFNIYSEEYDLTIRKVNPQDGYLKDLVFAPTVDSSATMIGPNTIVTTATHLTFNFVNHPDSVIHDTQYQMTNEDLIVKSNVPYELTNNMVVLDLSKHNTAFVTLSFVLSPFFEHAQPCERPIYSYVIHKLSH